MPCEQARALFLVCPTGSACVSRVVVACTQTDGCLPRDLASPIKCDGTIVGPLGVTVLVCVQGCLALRGQYHDISKMREMACEAF